MVHGKNGTNEDFVKGYLEEKGADEREIDLLIEYGLNGDVSVPVGDAVLEIDGQEYDEVGDAVEYVKDQKEIRTDGGTIEDRLPLGELESEQAWKIYAEQLNGE